MVHRLVLRGDPCRGGEVVHAEVGPDQPGPRRLAERGQAQPTIGIEQRRGHLDHELDGDRPLRDPEVGLEPGEQAIEDRELLGHRHLGQGHDERGNLGAPLGDHRRHHPLEGGDRPRRRRRNERLDANPGARRPPAVVGRDGDGPADALGLGVLLGIGPHPVSVLEVDPKILDRLRVQTRLDPGVNSLHQVVRGPLQGIGQGRRGRGVGGEDPARLLGQPGHGIGVMAVRAPVHGVHRGRAHRTGIGGDRRRLQVGEQIGGVVEDAHQLPRYVE